MIIFNFEDVLFSSSTDCSDSRIDCSDLRIHYNLCLHYSFR